MPLALSPFGTSPFRCTLVIPAFSLTVSVSKVANQAYETLYGPHFLPVRQNPSLMAQWDKRGLYRCRVVGLSGRVVYEVYGAGCYGGTTPFSGFQSQAEGLMTG